MKKIREYVAVEAISDHVIAGIILLWHQTNSSVFYNVHKV
jgi:hypothetical protein